jgi:hypothetical protein
MYNNFYICNSNLAIRMYGIHTYMKEWEKKLQLIFNKKAFLLFFSGIYVIFFFIFKYLAIITYYHKVFSFIVNNDLREIKG